MDRARITRGILGIIAVAAMLAASAQAQQLVTTINLPIPGGASKAVGGSPIVDEASNRIFMAVGDFGLTGGDIISIDGATRTVTGSIRISYNLGGGLAYDPISDRLFVPTFQGGIHVLDASSMSLLTTFTSLPETSFLAFDGTNNVLYASQWRFPYIDVVDAATGSHIGRIPVNASLPGELALNSAAGRLYMTGRQSGVYFLTIVDTVSRAVVAEETSAPWSSLELDLVNGRLYLGNSSTPTLGVLALSTGQLVASGVPLAPTSPSASIGGILYNPTTDRIHVTRVGSGTLDTLEAGDLSVASTLAIGSGTDYGLMDMAMSTGTGEFYVNHRDTNQGDNIPGRLHVLQDFRLVGIDIKPGSYPNSINLGSEGKVPVAILSSAGFDAGDVDPLTVTLASAPVRLKGKGTAMATLEDVNGDGLADLVVHVDTTSLELSGGDTEAQLDGATYSGEAIRGTDSVQIVP